MARRAPQKVFDIKSLAGHISKFSGPCESHPQEVLKDVKMQAALKKQAAQLLVQAARNSYIQKEKALAVQYPENPVRPYQEKSFRDALLGAIAYGDLGPGLHDKLDDILASQFTLGDLCRMIGQVQSGKTWF
jgi:hypothetical protein